MELKPIENDFEAKAFLNNLADEFDYDFMCSYFDAIFYDSDPSRGLLSSCYFLSCIDKKYSNSDNQKYNDFYLNRRREVSEDLFEHFKYFSNSNEETLIFWTKLFNLFQADKNLINNLIFEDLSHSSGFLYLIEELDLSFENRKLISKWIESGINVVIGNFSVPIYNFSEDLQKEILLEQRINFVTSKSRFFEIIQ